MEASPTEAPVIGGGDDHSVNLLTISPPDPLQPISPNQQRDGPSLLSPKDGRDRSVAEKVSQFNTMALQAKQQERKLNDAALQRAVLGREEAEAEVRRLRDEVKVLRQQVEEGKDREKQVSHRLEVVMVSLPLAHNVFPSLTGTDCFSNHRKTTVAPNKP